MLRRNIRTTIVGVVMLIAFLGLTAGLIFDKIEASDYGVALAAIATFGTAVIGILAADSKKRLNDEK